MKSDLISTLRLSFVMFILLVVVYPLAVLGISHFAPGNGQGEFVYNKNRPVGMLLVGQRFSQDQYFQGRPSAIDYNSSVSGGSNKGPSNPEYLTQVKARIDTFAVHNPGIRRSVIPSLLFTASGSGLDPHLSPLGAIVQVPRIAKLRKISESVLLTLVKQHTEPPLWGMFGPEKVNTLQLNLALDQMCPPR